MYTYGADAVDLAEIPDSYTAMKNRGVLLYGNGKFSEVNSAKHYPRHLLISTTGDVRSATTCDMLDVERFDATAEQWPEWRAARDTWCKSENSNRWPKVYCSIDPDEDHGVPAIVKATRDAKQERVKHWAIAYYTGRIMTPQALASDIRILTGEVISWEDIWGCQYDTGHYDAWVIYQNPQWA
jgi:hypothetical protein